MSLRNSQIIIVFLCFLFFGCEKNSDPVGEAMCSKFFECCPNGIIAGMMLMVDKSDCLMINGYANMRMEEVTSAPNSNIEIDKDKLKLCNELTAQLYDTLTCDIYIKDHPGYEEMKDVCDKAYIGKLEEGEHCELSIECKDDLKCQRKSSAQEFRCIQVEDDTVASSEEKDHLSDLCILRDEGAECDFEEGTDLQCSEKLYCSSEDVCIDRKLDGEVCVEDIECLGVCMHDECVPKRKKGDSCIDSDDCNDMFDIIDVVDSYSRVEFLICEEGVCVELDSTL